jgi:hypothetical protein
MKKQPKYSQKSSTAPYAWSAKLAAKTGHSGQRSRRSRPRSAVRQNVARWVRQQERDTGLRPGPTSAEEERVKALEREVRALTGTCPVHPPEGENAPA